jgi:hypothetical protein
VKSGDGKLRAWPDSWTQRNLLAPPGQSIYGAQEDKMRLLTLQPAGPGVTSLVFAANLLGISALACLACAAGCSTGPEAKSGSKPTRSSRTVLGVAGSRFTINGQPTFLLGLSYYAGLGAPEEFIRKDVDDAQHFGFNWLRVWANWNQFDNDASAVDSEGQPREPTLQKLEWLVSECDRRGLVLDLTLARSQPSGRATAGQLSGLPTHRRAVETLVTRLKPYGNWYLDLANEHDVRDGRYVPASEIQILREVVREIDPARLVTASYGGHDLELADLRNALLTERSDFVCPHRPREPGSASQTAVRTRACLALMQSLGGRVVPVHYQEPFRRGYTTWEPTAADFLADLQGAVAGGAAGWCFHNGSQRNTTDHQPRRSFDLRTRRLFDQFDPVERQVLAKLKAALGSP